MSSKTRSKRKLHSKQSGGGIDTLIKAIEDNNIREVITQLSPRLFHKQVAIDTKDADGNTPLSRACMGAKHEIIRLLLSPTANKWKKADVNSKNNKGETPLILLLRSVELYADRNRSTVSNYYEYVAKSFTSLMEASAAIDIADIYGITPLMLSVYCLGKGYGEDQNSISYICHTLLELTKNINAVTTSNTTFVSFLSAVPNLRDEEYTPVLKRLDEKGEILVTNTHGVKLQTPLHIAIGNHAEKLVDFLIRKGADINALDYLENTPLMYIDANSTSDGILMRLITRLIDAGASVRTINKEGIDFIYSVCNFMKNAASAYSIVLELLKRSDDGTLAPAASAPASAVKEVIDVNYIYPNGTVLMSLCSRIELPKGLELFNELLKRSADINARNTLGETPLIKVIQSMARLQSTGDPAATCVNTLLGMKADITGALQAAATYNFRNFPLIKVLLDIGADPNIMVTMYYSYDTTSFLQLMITSINEKFDLPSFTKDELKSLIITIILTTIPKITDINSKDHIYSGGSPLIYACMAKNKDIVAELLDKGIDMKYISYMRSSNLPEILYQTPLMLACGDYQHEGIVKLLLEKGADPNFGPRHGNGDSRALWALYYTIPFNFPILQLLVEHKVNINLINIYGLPFIHALCIPRRGLSSDILVSIFQYLLENSNIDINLTNKNKYNLFHTVLIENLHIPLLILLFKYINKEYTVNTLLQSKSVIFIVLEKAPALLVECIQELKNVNITYNNYTLLDTCIFNNLPEPVLALLKKNAKMSSSTTEYAITKMNPIPLELLHKIPDIHIELSSSKSILAEIITRSPVLDNYMDAITTVLQLGFDVNKKDSYGKTALMYSVYISNLPITIKLLEHSSSITVFDNNKNNILYYLFTAKQSDNNVEICNVLLQELFKLDDEELFIFLITAHSNRTIGYYFNTNSKEYLVTSIKKFISEKKMK
jgi:ankyrin repeat protein